MRGVLRRRVGVSAAGAGTSPPPLTRGERRPGRRRRPVTRSGQRVTRLQVTPGPGRRAASGRGEVTTSAGGGTTPGAELVNIVGENQVPISPRSPGPPPARRPGTRTGSRAESDKPSPVPTPAEIDLTGDAHRQRLPAASARSDISPQRPYRDRAPLPMPCEQMPGSRGSIRSTTTTTTATRATGEKSRRTVGVAPPNNVGHLCTRRRSHLSGT